MFLKLCVTLLEKNNCQKLTFLVDSGANSESWIELVQGETLEFNSNYSP